MERVNVWNTYDLERQKSCFTFAEDYRRFISENKTERECVDSFVNAAEDAGYVELSRAIEEAEKNGKKLQPGDKVYMTWMNKSMVLFRLGTRPMEEGVNILGAHIDSPRMDVKQNPLYEKGGYGYLDTHYYGGIKKYQFVARPLAIHGVIVKKDGETVVLNVGEDADDPVFFISDLLIHLAQDQMQKKAAEVVEGEALDLIIGNKPIIIDAKTKSGKKKEELPKEAVKNSLLAILEEMYGIKEDDFESAELEVVPAGPARSLATDMMTGFAHIPLSAQSWMGNSTGRTEHRSAPASAFW